jgi:type II secretory pathway component PulF
MPHGGRRNADEQLLLALACGATIEAAAQKAGISRATATRRARDPEFQRRLQEIRSETVMRTSHMLTAAGMEFVKNLLELARPPSSAAVRLGATKAGLELGAKLRETVELEQRLTQLEQRLNEQEKSEP